MGKYIDNYEIILIFLLSVIIFIYYYSNQTPLINVGSSGTPTAQCPYGVKGMKCTSYPYATCWPVCRNKHGK